MDWGGGGRFCEERNVRALGTGSGVGAEKNGVRCGVGTVSLGCLGGKGRRGYGQESPGALWGAVGKYKERWKGASEVAW